MHLIMIIPRNFIRRMSRRVQNTQPQIRLVRFRLAVFLVPDGPFEAFERVGVVGDFVPGDGGAYVLEFSMAFEVGFDEVAAGGGGDDFCRAAGEELGYAAYVVVVAVGAEDVVLVGAGGVEWLTIVCLDWVVFDVVS